MATKSYWSESECNTYNQPVVTTGCKVCTGLNKHTTDWSSVFWALTAAAAAAECTWIELRHVSLSLYSVFCHRLAPSYSDGLDSFTRCWNFYRGDQLRHTSATDQAASEDLRWLVNRLYRIARIPIAIRHQSLPSLPMPDSIHKIAPKTVHYFLSNPTSSNWLAYKHNLRRFALTKLANIQTIDTKTTLQESCAVATSWGALASPAMGHLGTCPPPRLPA